MSGHDRARSDWAEREQFWMRAAGDETLGMTLGICAETLARDGIAEALEQRILAIDREESVGPLLDPTFWRETRNAFGRTRLERRAKWDGEPP